jgi:6-phosphogluconolactonase
VILAGGGKWLLAVNAGSNDISTFRVRDDGRLTLTDRAGADGTDPVSLTADDGLVYVLDAGGSGNIAGFRLDDGKLHHIGGSVQALSGSATNPAEVAFSTNGRFLVVTERATNLIDTYSVDSAGTRGRAQDHRVIGTGSLRLRVRSAEPPDRFRGGEQHAVVVPAQQAPARR